MTKKKKQLDRPKYIIKVHRNWIHGPRARFWDIETWIDSDFYKNGGYWSKVCGGLAFTERGMWWAINRRIKKMQFGYQDNYFTVDKKEIEEPK